jgi:hypothetical protein
MAEQKLIDSQLWADHIIHCPGIMKRADAYMKKKALNAKRQADSRARNKEKKEKEAQESNALQSQSNALLTPNNADVTPSKANAESHRQIQDQDPISTQITDPVNICTAEPRFDKGDLPVFSESRPNLVVVSPGFQPQKTLDYVQPSPVNNLAEQRKDDCSAAPPVDPVKIFIDIYNQDKPSRWAGCRKTSDLRTKWIKKFVKEHKAESTELFQKALRWAAQDPWWSSMSLGFNTLTHKEHVLEFAERWDAIASQPSSQANVDDLVMNVMRKKFEERNGRAANW